MRKIKLPKNFYTARVDDEGGVDLCQDGEVQVYVRLVNDPTEDQFMRIYRMAGEDFVCLNFELGGERGELRFTKEHLAKMLSLFDAHAKKGGAA